MEAEGSPADCADAEMLVNRYMERRTVNPGMHSLQSRNLGKARKWIFQNVSRERGLIEPEQILGV